jgi:hypothetical protein
MSRTPPQSGLSDKRKGIYYEASRCQARSTRLVHIDTAAWRPQEGPHLTDAGYQPSEAHSEIRDMLRRPLSAR